MTRPHSKRSPRTRTLTLGVTGGIGSGKSEVCRILKSLGARIFYADDVGKEILSQDPEARRELVELVGPEAYGADGTLQRALVARQVFSDPERLTRLNEIVHPRVFRAFEDARSQAERDGVRLLVKEAALLFESGGHRHLDAVLLVDAPVEDRIARVVRRDGGAEEDVRARLRHQSEPASLRARADFVIDNTGSLEALERAVREVFDELRRRKVSQKRPG